MKKFLQLSDLLASGSRWEISRVHLDPVKSARTLGFHWAVSRSGTIVQASFKGENISVDAMEFVFFCLASTSYNNISRKFECDLPPVDIIGLYGIRVVDDVHGQAGELKTSDKLEHEVNLSALLASGDLCRISRIYFESEKVARILGFDWIHDETGKIIRAAFMGERIAVNKLKKVIHSMTGMYYDYLTMRLEDAESFYYVLCEYEVEIIDDVSVNTEER